MFYDSVVNESYLSNFINNESALRYNYKKQDIGASLFQKKLLLKMNELVELNALRDMSYNENAIVYWEANNHISIVKIGGSKKIFMVRNIKL